MDLRDRYPEIERPLRGDGGPEAVKRCREPVIKNLEAIISLVKNCLAFKNLEVKEMYLFQSRAMGTCKPTSDIDIYVQLFASEAFIYIMDYSVLYKNTGKKIICGKGKEEFFKNLPEKFKEKLKKLRVCLFLGIFPIPPAKDEYKGRNYYVNLRDL